MLHLASGVSADFEGENPLEVTIRATDSRSGAHYDETFTINVTDVNEAPVADDSVSFTMSEDGTLLIEEAALLGSSSDPDNDVLHIENLELGEGASGTLTLNDESAAEGSRTWTYAPVGDFNGSVALSYAVSDGELTDTVQTTITVTPIMTLRRLVETAQEVSRKTMMVSWLAQLRRRVR